MLDLDIQGPQRAEDVFHEGHQGGRQADESERKKQHHQPGDIHRQMHGDKQRQHQDRIQEDADGGKQNRRPYVTGALDDDGDLFYVAIVLLTNQDMSSIDRPTQAIRHR